MVCSHQSIYIVSRNQESSNKPCHGSVHGYSQILLIKLLKCSIFIMSIMYYMLRYFYRLSCFSYQVHASCTRIMPIIHHVQVKCHVLLMFVSCLWYQCCVSCTRCVSQSIHEFKHLPYHNHVSQVTSLLQLNHISVIDLVSSLTFIMQSRCTPIIR